MMQFKAFKPQAMNKIAGAMGYTGDMNQFQNYIEQDPMRQQQMQKYNNAAMQMARGGVVKKMAEGGTPNVDPAGVQQYNSFSDHPAFTSEPLRERVFTPPVGGPGGVGSMPVSDNPNAPNVYFGAAPTPQDIDAKGPRKAIDPAVKRPFDDEGEDYNPYPPGHPLNPSEPDTPTAGSSTINEATLERMYQPGLPVGGVVQAATTASEAGQYLAPETGTITGSVAVPTTTAGTAQASPLDNIEANVITANTSAPAIDTAMLATQAAQITPEDPRAQVTAAQQTATSVGDLTAAQGNATLINSPVKRSIQDGELISGVANAQTAATFNEQIEAATATPSKQATIQGQLEGLMTQFDGGETPAWAAGAMRAATAAMSARGLGASSLAGQAVVQAAMESALPIAQADAQITAQFEGQNLSNRQQRAMLAAQQRAQFMGMEFDQAFQARVQNASKISDVANMNFTAEQQVQLENSRAANTMNLNNLSNSQAMVMAEAAALANMDSQNLNNRQQASVANAQSFMNREMANLSNQQQTEMFKAQSRVQSLFTDQAAINAASQFNATSQNQTDQFFSNLNSQTAQFNASQTNAQEQFNAGQINTLERFNAELNNQRDQFNAQNQLVISQSNAQWRREIATADTAAVNRANELNATSILDISKSAYDNLWSYYADTMEWAWTSAESEQNRIADMAIASLNASERSKVAGEQSKTASGAALGGLIGTLGSAFIGAKF